MPWISAQRRCSAERLTSKSSSAIREVRVARKDSVRGEKSVYVGEERRVLRYRRQARRQLLRVELLRGVDVEGVGFGGDGAERRRDRVLEGAKVEKRRGYLDFMVWYWVSDCGRELRTDRVRSAIRMMSSSHDSEKVVVQHPS